MTVQGNDVVQEAPRFLVVDPMPLVAEDLAELLREAHPGADVVLASTASQAVAWLADLPGLTAAFVNLCAEDLAKADLPARIEALGGAVVSLWGDRPIGAGRWFVLDLPFSAESLRSVLGRLG